MKTIYFTNIVQSELLDLLLDLRNEFLTYDCKIEHKPKISKILIVWNCTSSNRSVKFLLSIPFMSNVKNLTQNMEINNYVADMLSSLSGRDKLAALLCSHDEDNILLKHLDRMLKMKAFW